MDLSLLLMIASFIGARLFHVFYESFDYYKEDFTRVFRVADGGFVYFGGALLAGLLGVLYITYKEPKRNLRYLDAFAPVVALSYGLGRVGCLLAGCCYGRVCDLPWSLEGRHPTQAYAMAWELCVVAFLLWYEKRQRKSGSLFYMWMILHGVGRLIMEYFRDDYRGPVPGVTISSWISFGLVLLGTWLMIRKEPHEYQS
jgi:phosphatidylglycerol:prolipoprotein diacylglycerol transferase